MNEFLENNNSTDNKDNSSKDILGNSNLYNAPYNVAINHNYLYDASKGEHHTVSLDKNSPDDKNIASFSSTGIERITSFDITGNDLTINYGGFYYSNLDAGGQSAANQTGDSAHLQENSVTIKNYFLGDGFDLYRYNDGISSYNGNELLSAAPYAAVNFVGEQSNLIKTAYNNVVTGDSSNSWLFGDNNNDTIIGGSGNETIFTGVYGNNTVVGGTGDDTINVGAHSSNRFTFSKGDGNDTIVNAGASWGRNVVDFTGISSSDIVSIKQTSEDTDKGYSTIKRNALTIQYSDKDSLTITNSSWQPYEDLFQFKFDDKTLTGQQLLDLYHATSASNQILPSASSDTQPIKGALISDFYKADSNIKDSSAVKDVNIYNHMGQEQQSMSDYQVPLLAEHTASLQNNAVLMNV